MRAKVIALQLPKPDYDTTEELDSIRADIRGLQQSIESLAAQIVKPDDSKVLAAIAKIKPVSLEPVIKAIGSLSARVEEIETQRANTKLSVSFDVLTDAAGDIRQIVAKET